MEQIGNFRLLRPLGSGYSAKVFLAELIEAKYGLEPGEKVALKFYKEHIIEEINQIRRISREYFIGKQLQHQNLLKIYDLCEIPRPFLVMEYLEGMTLSDWIIRRGGCLDNVEEFYRIARQILYGLEKLHTVLFHRDIKTSNIFVTDLNVVKIMDFGVVRPFSDPTITQPYKFLGTIRYSAPEYLFNGIFDYRSDLYSVGAVFYEMLFGSPIFADIRRFSEIVLAVKKEQPEFNMMNKKITLDTVVLIELIKALLDKVPNNRPDNTAVVIETLDKGEQSRWWKSRFPRVYSRGIEGETRRIRLNTSRIRKEALRKIAFSPRIGLSERRRWLKVLKPAFTEPALSREVERLLSDLSLDKDTMNFLWKYYSETDSLARKKILADFVCDSCGRMAREIKRAKMVYPIDFNKLKEFNRFITVIRRRIGRNRPVVISVLEDLIKKDRYRDIAATCLVKLKGEGVASIFIKAIEQKYSKLRKQLKERGSASWRQDTQLVYLLGELRDKKNVPFLLNLIQNYEFFAEQEEALKSLGKIGDRMAASVVMKQLWEWSENPYRYWEYMVPAIRCLKKIGDRATGAEIEKLEELLKECTDEEDYVIATDFSINGMSEEEIEGIMREDYHTLFEEIEEALDELLGEVTFPKKKELVASK